MQTAGISTRDVGTIARVAEAAANGSGDWNSVAVKLAETLRVDASVILTSNHPNVQASPLNSKSPIIDFLGASPEIPQAWGDASPGCDPEPGFMHGRLCRRIVRDHRLYQSWLRPAGMSSLATILAEHGPNFDTSCRLSVIRDGRRIRFEGRDKDALGLFLPHLQHAFTLSALRARIEFMKYRWDRLLGSLQTGVILLDRTGAVVEENGVATAILERGDGIRCVGRRLFVRLGRNVVDAGSRFLGENGIIPCTFAVQRSPGKSAYKVSCNALTDVLRPGPGQSEPVALLLIEDLDANPTQNYEFVAASYQITPREMEVLRLLIEGELRPNAIAEKLGISVRTVRCQLSSIYSKTGTSGQKELMMLILRGQA